MELNQEKDKMAPEATAAEEIPAETVIEETAEAEAPVPEASAAEGEEQLSGGQGIRRPGSCQEGTKRPGRRLPSSGR